MEKRLTLDEVLSDKKLPWGTDDLGNVIDCDGGVIAKCFIDGASIDRAGVIAGIISDSVGRQSVIPKTACCEIGSYSCQVPMPLNGRVQGIDKCIADIVAALNAGGIFTKASCCGHGKMDGIIVLEDGRELRISEEHTNE